MSVNLLVAIDIQLLYFLTSILQYIAVESINCLFPIIHGDCSGLMAGNIWGKTWPDSKGNILAASSLYDASMKV